MSLFCTNCEQQYADGSAFCDRCGSSLAAGCPNGGTDHRAEDAAGHIEDAAPPVPRVTPTSHVGADA